MFSEELSRNSSRKRAEENKARRRQLKEQQAKKAASAETPPRDALTPRSQAITGSTSSAVHTAATAAIHSTTAENPSALCLQVRAVQLPIAPSCAEIHQPQSAVELAERDRQRRAQEARLVKAATTLQSFVRFCLSNFKVRSEIALVLERRLADLATLGKMLLAKNMASGQAPSGTGDGWAYVPPVSTTTSFAQQLLFLSRSNRNLRCTRDDQPIVRLPASSWSTLLASFLDICILPPLETTQASSMNHLVSWMATIEGQMRLEGVLRLSVVAVFSTDTTSKNREVLLRFARCLLVVAPTSHRPSPSGLTVQSVQVQTSSCAVFHHCRAMLLMKAAPGRFGQPLPSSSSPQVPCARRGSPIDLIVSLRYYLMFVVAGAPSMPIPSNAKDLRDKCIPESLKAVAGNLWRLVVDAIQSSNDIPERQLLHCRVVSDLLTVPLLTWKLSPAAVDAFVSSAESRPVLLDAVRSFVELRAEAIDSGAIQQLLVVDDVPLTVCPATPSQCLFANLLQFSIACPAVNGADTTKMDYSSATLFYTILCTILDALPLPTFSSRDSSVEWMTDGKGHHTPIVLSSVILDQCKLILLDSLVRRLFNCSISAASFDHDAVLARKSETDLKHEKNLLDSGAASASMLAAKEARVDRSVGFWNSSKWARKISKGVSTILSGDAVLHPPPPTSRQSRKVVSYEGLVNTSSMSRLLAGGKQNPPLTSEPSDSIGCKGQHGPGLFLVLCRLYSIVLARWGGGGHDDIINRGPKSSDGRRASTATTTAESCMMSLLNVLGFSTQVLKASWAMIESDNSIRAEVEAMINTDRSKVPIRTFSIRPSLERLTAAWVATAGNGAILLYMFVATMAHVLIVTDDVEIHDMDRPLPIHQLRRCVEVLKKLLYRSCYLDERDGALQSNYFGLALVSAASRTMRDLYDRSSRRPICVPKLWLVPDLFEKEIRQCKSSSAFVALLAHPVLRLCPFLVSFKRRLKIFERIVTTNRVEVQGVNDLNPFNPNPLKPGIPVRIMRGRLLEDGLATMNHLGSNMRRRIAVQYVNEAGVQETGIDAGGLFKEFWTDLSAIAFNPNYALFRITEGAGNCLYPNPSSGAAHGSDHIVLFEFLGRILGKALYEGITINPCFAHFFLSFLRGDYNYLHMLPDLSTVDPQLYSNLMFLKTYDGDAAELCLTFTVTSDEFGGTREIPLIPNGANVDVTSNNKQRYIGLVAKHYVVDRVKEQSEAFTRGLWEVIDRSWLRIFNEPELQVLISGSSEGKLDVDDLRANTKYVGGYTSLDRNISRFWSVVAGLDSIQQQALLRFVTSCERPPPLGFASMNPAFTIQRVGLTRDDGKLPASSTCFNTLKLPIYSSDKVMKERILYAIQSGAGFELT
jgi:ubiquitin-protein ligase E3 C